jgi:glycosyltransferase involved in cell wall biosynthesis
MNQHKNVLMVGADLTSNGGIASVVKALYEAHSSGGYAYRVYLIKTSFYKDKNAFYEMLIFIKSISLALFLSMTNDVGIFHIHTSAKYSFYRKSFFVLMAKLLKKKVILHIHASEFYSFFLKDSWFIKYILGMSDSVVVLCSDWKSVLSKMYPNLNIIKIENPYNLSSSTSPLCHSTSCGKIRVVFVGFLIESKGLRDLVDLASYVKSSGRTDVIIQIAGKGELETFVRDSIERMELQGFMDFTGWVSGEDKDNLYRNADLFILPSYREGMPISILEAMAWGLPVISTRIAGTPDVIKDGVNGFLFEPGDINGYYGAICKLADDDSMRMSMCQSNLERVKQNSKENIFTQINELYVNLRHA